jgi:O-antigen/teichoic acid export membrane protein
MSKSVKRVVKNSFFQTFGAFGITGFNFVLMLGYARILGPENFGSLVTSQAQVLVWTILVELGLSHSLIGALTLAEGGRTELSRQGFRARDLLFRVLLVRLSGAVIGSIFIYFIARAHAGENEALFWQEVAFAPHLFALALQQTAVSLAMYRHRQGLSVISNLLGVSVTVVLALTLAWQGASIPWLLLAQSWGGMLSAFVIFGFFFLQAVDRRRSGQTRRVEKSKTAGGWGGEAWRALAQDAWPYAISYGVFVLWQRLDQIAASRLLGFEQGGQYALAVRLVAIPILIATSISFALFPDLQRVGRDAPDKVQVILGAVSKVIWRYGIIGAALILLALGYLLVPLVPKFQPALKLLPYFVPGVWAFWMQSFLMNSLFGIRRYRLVVLVHLKSLAVYLPSVYWLTVKFDLHGVVWAFNIFCLSMCFFGFRAAISAGVLPADYRLYGSFTKEERALWPKAGWLTRIFGGRS